MQRVVGVATVALFSFFYLNNNIEIEME